MYKRQVSRYGLIAYGSSLDQIGPIAKDVTDCATILEAIASYDKKDSTSVNRDDLKFTEALVDDVKGMKIGIPKDYLGDGLDPEVKSAILAAADELKKKGAVVELSLIHILRLILVMCSISTLVCWSVPLVSTTSRR